MSYDPSFDPDDFEGLTEKSRNIPVRVIKEFEAKAKRLAELEAKEAARERATELAEAGIPAEFAALFREDAPLDALKNAFGQMGGGQPSTTQQSLDGHQAAQSMASGAQNASPTGADADAAAWKQEARDRKNWHMGSAKEQSRLNARLAQEGVDPNLRRLDTSNWKLPGQLVG